MHDRTFPPDSTEQKIVDVIKTCYDPEIPVDILELGLIYDIQVGEDKVANVSMTLTSPACPVAGSLPPEIQQKVKDMVPDLEEVNVDLVWDPPWNIDMMSEAAKLDLGMM